MPEGQARARGAPITMKAPDFDYHRPDTLEAALALLADGTAEPLAGGQSLMPMMNFRLTAPERLVDLNRIAGLDGIEVAEGWLTIGAMTRYGTLERSDTVAGAAPLLAAALGHIAHPAIRNRGTVGGSVALADPAAELPAVLLALGGEVVLRGPSGTRSVAADDFFLGIYETARAPGELVTAIRLPAAERRTGFYEIVQRHGDYAMAGCAVAATGDLSAVRVAFFGVADRAVRSAAAEAALAGSDGGKAALDAAVAALGDVAFEGGVDTTAATKRHLAGVALRRAWGEVMA